MLYSNIDEAYDNPMELQYNRYKNNMFSPVAETEQDSVTTIDHDYTLLDKHTSQEMKDRYFSAQGNIGCENLKGTTIDELREKSNKFSPDDLYPSNYDDEGKRDLDIVFKDKPKSHKYYVDKFIKDIERSDDMSVNTGGTVYNHVRECLICKDTVNKYFDKKNIQTKKVINTNKIKKINKYDKLNNTEYLNTVIISLIIGIIVIFLFDFTLRFMSIIHR